MADQEYQAQIKALDEAMTGEALEARSTQIRIAHEMGELTSDEVIKLRKHFVTVRGKLKTQQPARQQQEQQTQQQRPAQQNNQQRQQGQQQGSQGQQQEAKKPTQSPLGFWAHLPAPGDPGVLSGSAPPVPAPYRRQLAAILYDLRTKVHPQMIEKRKQGGSDVDFISWHVRCRHLDVYAPGWKDEVIAVREVDALVPHKPTDINIKGSESMSLPLYFKPGTGNRPDEPLVPTTLVCVTARLIIPAEEGDFWHDATGYEDVRNGGYGDAFSNASAMALSRCASKFGQGIHLYGDPQ
jgi:hypothetical protein